MTPREFCYWLQGYFELLGVRTDISSTSAEDRAKLFACIQAHINMVKATKGNFSPELLSFMGWVESAIEFDANLSQISTKLNGIFEHVIDPSSGDTDGYQQAAHDGPWSTPGMKC